MMPFNITAGRFNNLPPRYIYATLNAMLRTLVTVSLCLASIWPSRTSAQDVDQPLSKSSSSVNCVSPTMDGYTYDVIELGHHCWFAENLRTAIYATGDSIPADLNEAQWEMSIAVGGSAIYGEGDSYCYDDFSDFPNCDETFSLQTYGRLYNSYAVFDSRGLCPVQWRVPRNSEWDSLEAFVSSSIDGGSVSVALKADYGWDLDSVGTDDFGFRALPGGSRGQAGQFVFAGSSAKWWSRTLGPWNESLQENLGVFRQLSQVWLNVIFESANQRRVGLSVRCVQCLNDEDQDGICDEDEVYGCIYEDACNYSDEATEDGGSCDYVSCSGCTDPIACNYDVEATIEGGCQFPIDIYGSAFLDCFGNCLNDEDGDNVCDEEDVCVGTVDACGICNGPGAIYGCGCFDIPAGDCDCDGNQLDALGVCGGACPADVDEDGICDDLDDCVGVLDACGVCNGPGEIYECGCTSIPAGDCDCEGSVPPLGYDCDGECLNDADNDGVCDEFEVLGCDDEGACNFNAGATENDESCIYPGAPCSDGLALTFDDFLQNDCSCNGYGCIVETACNYEPEAIPSAELCDYESCLGCTDNWACNFDLASTLDDGSCSYPGEPCDDGNALTITDVYQSNCSCEGVPVQGCVNNQACNFNPIASIPDGSCLFPGAPCDDLNPLTFEDFIDENCYCGNYPVVSVTMNAAPELMVFPNPAKDVITIEAKAYYEPYTLSVYDASLRLVHSRVDQGRSILDISPFARGMYLIEVKTLVGTTRSRVLFD